MLTERRTTRRKSLDSDVIIHGHPFQTADNPEMNPRAFESHHIEAIPAHYMSLLIALRYTGLA